MRARAWLAAAAAVNGTTEITRLHSEPPLVLRPTNRALAEPRIPWSHHHRATARVSIAAGAAGPIGGDDLELEIDIGPGAALVLRTVAASLVLPGPRGETSRTRMTVRVGAGATFVCLPEPIIAAAGCHHRAVTTISLDRGARLLVREEMILGRANEAPGSISQRLRVTHAGRPLHTQELCIGAAAPAWQGPAVTGGRRAVGTLLLVDPSLAAEPPVSGPAGGPGVDLALLPLAGPAVLVTALAPDSLALRRRLDQGLGSLRRGLLPAERHGARDAVGAGV